MQPREYIILISVTFTGIYTDYYKAEKRSALLRDELNPEPIKFGISRRLRNSRGLAALKSPTVGSWEMAVI